MEHTLEEVKTKRTSIEKVQEEDKLVKIFQMIQDLNRETGEFLQNI